MIKFPCGKCGRAFTVRPEFAGKVVKCPKCGASAEVPAQSVEIAVTEVERAYKGPGASRGREVAVCEKHPNRRSVGQCAICKAPLCAECREELGYYCSPEHKSKALGEAPALKLETAADTEAEAKAQNVLRWMKRGALAVAGVLVVFFVGRFLFAKGGRLRWETALGGDGAATLLGGPGAIRAVTAEGRILVFDDAGSKTGEHTMAVKPGWGGIGTTVGDLALFGDEDGTVAVSLVDGKLAWRHPGRASSGWFTSGLVLDKETFYLTRQELSPEEQAAVGKTKKVMRRSGKAVISPEIEVEEPDVDPKYQHLVGAQTHLVAVDARTGKEKWKSAFEKPLQSVLLDAGAGHILVREARWSGDMSVQATLTLHSGSDGRGLFRIDPKVELLGNPLFTPHGLVVVKATGLECLKYADGSKAWAVPVNLGGARSKKSTRDRSFEADERPMKNLWVIGETILLHVGRNLICVQVADGKTRWSVDSGAWLSGMVESGGVLVCSGGTEKRLADTLKNAPPFTIGQNELTEIVAEEMPGASMIIPVTVGIDAATGKSLWSAPVSGEFLDTGRGIAIFQTASRPDLYARIGQPGHTSQTFIMLLDPASGSILWEYSVPGSITKPLAVDRTLVFGVSEKEAPATLVAVWIR